MTSPENPSLIERVLLPDVFKWDGMGSPAGEVPANGQLAHPLSVRHRKNMMILRSSLVD
jgi:hypothetical protein